ncbi:DUF533 domain-containing protein [Desertifilum sp. FACHB-1129]|uniref:Nitrogenase n=2 Tax=Desertifilum tharense IPPAS B-1220 TaxID=1781255 RepID=A0A1E5QN30_9CYAN|nr:MULTISPECIES: DUF533 domain-containing protein [Desertifilum]MDA0208868.1 DUF533 domain-containing protein [Cyanobacteria bacterium FC1]MBD2311069.1 DUF533 domain-containing protein [Desertifilum sp. FACHB-1129]MBD2321474.1 DUF533 domain-containing protein [Desertifilum sp. FACHB-866]MBD2331219.1 DUF533 domain-containing protein [Desertifilum sp. FACHB-868]OEJ76004.1 nitrogenase [Desertifilum tharense IPPAS B-1220]
MTGVINSPYTSEQIAIWLRGLLTLAWADGHFDEEERELIASITQDELAPSVNLDEVETITPEQLAAALSEDRVAAENFLRTAVMVAVADGVYSPSEHELLQQFSQALGFDPEILNALRSTYDGHLAETDTGLHPRQSQSAADLLHPAREWLDGLDVRDPRVARFLCKLIPPQCPFERDVKLFGHKVVHIPAMCKLNPLYDQLVGLRFRALSYLADDCGEDVSRYC